MSKEELSETLEENESLRFSCDGYSYYLQKGYSSGKSVLLFGREGEEADIYPDINTLYRSLYRGERVQDIFETVPLEEVEVD